jgi:hypothetical protein
MIQGAMKGAMDVTSDRSGSKRWIKRINRRKHGSGAMKGFTSDGSGRRDGSGRKL